MTFSSEDSLRQSKQFVGVGSTEALPLSPGLHPCMNENPPSLPFSFFLSAVFYTEGNGDLSPRFLTQSKGEIESFSASSSIYLCESHPPVVFARHFLRFVRMHLHRSFCLNALVASSDTTSM